MKIELDSIINLLNKEINSLNKERIRYLVSEEKDDSFLLRRVSSFNYIKDLILSNFSTDQRLIKSPCGKKFAKCQWWSYCGETDMGQSAPVKCTQCGGNFILQEDVDKYIKDYNE